MTEHENIRHVLADGTEFKIIYAGEMKSENGQLIKWDDSIKLVQGKKQIKLSAVALSQLIGFVQQDDVKAVLQGRFQAEVKKLQKLQGF